ncbi:MAG: hypothetical protein ACK4MS_03940 [Paracoccaceae bacterium]
MDHASPRPHLPPFDPGYLLPGIMAVSIYPLLMALTGDQSASFVTAFFMGMWVILARNAEWVARYFCKTLSTRMASLLAVCAALGPASILMMLDKPEWCLRLFSAMATVACLVIVNDLRDGDHAYLRFRLPSLSLHGAEAELAQAFMTWNLALILLTEGVIQMSGILGWMLWYAALPLVIYAAEAAIITGVLHRRRVAS